MSTTTELDRVPRAEDRSGNRRLLVTLQDHGTRSYRPVGFLTACPTVGSVSLTCAKRSTERASAR